MKLIINDRKFEIVNRNTNAKLNPATGIMVKSSSDWCNTAGNHTIVVFQPETDPKGVWEMLDVLPNGRIALDGYGVKFDADMDAMLISQQWVNNNFALLSEF